MGAELCRGRVIPADRKLIFVKCLPQLGKGHGVSWPLSRGIGRASERLHVHGVSPDRSGLRLVPAFAKSIKVRLPGGQLLSKFHSLPTSLCYTIDNASASRACPCVILLLIQV